MTVQEILLAAAKAGIITPQQYNKDMKIWIVYRVVKETDSHHLLYALPTEEDAIDAIKQIIKSGKWLRRSLLPAKLAVVFFYPPGKPAIASAASTAVNLHGVTPADINAREWEVLARAIIAVPKIVRTQVYSIAQQEAIKHQSENKQVLYHFWKGVCDVFE